MWHFPSARFAPFCAPDTRSFIHTARDVDGRSEHDACGIRDETTETANSWRKQCRELCQNCAKTLSNCDVGAYFEREADSPKLLETLESESKGKNRWNAGPCLALFEEAGTGCSTSQCSTTLPFSSKRKMSTPAVSFPPQSK